MTTPFEPLLTAGEAAELLRIHEKTLQSFARAGRVPAVRLAEVGSSVLPRLMRGCKRAYSLSNSHGARAERRNTLQFERNTYQTGSLRKVARKKGPPVWEFRFRDNTRPGSPMRQMTLSTVEHPTEARARKALQPMLLDLNGTASFKQNNVVTVGNLIDRFVQDERLETIVAQRPGDARVAGGLQYSTAVSYRTILERYIRPKWGTVPVEAVKPIAIDGWLRGLSRLCAGVEVPVSPKTKGHIKSLMHRLWERAMLWDLVPFGRNPLQLIEVRGVSKRQKKPLVLTVEQYQAIVERLEDPYRLMVQVSMCLGLRVSEVLALQWQDFDFAAGTLKVTRGTVHGRVSSVKTEYSEDELPLDPSFAEPMARWRSQCMETAEGWVFPNPTTGKVFHAGPIQQDYIAWAGREAGLLRTVGWHTFRHTYRSLLDDAGAPVGVQQKLMRHAQVATTMNVYGDAQMRFKREANRNVVRMVLPIPNANALRAAS